MAGDNTSAEVAVSSGPAGGAAKGDGLGWALFAGSMIVIGGIFNLIDGLAAVFDSGFFQSVNDEHKPALLVTSHLAAWGGVSILIGAIMIVAGLAVYTQEMWARVSGIVIAGLNMVFQFAFMSAFTTWSVIMILIDVVVIYALAVAGRRPA